MIKKSLFNNQIEVVVSDLSDGSMRYFGNGDENQIIENQQKLGATLNLTSDKIARVRTVYDGRTNYTEYYEITPENLNRYSIANPESSIAISDGLVTKYREIGILLPLADCLGAVVYSKKQGLVGLLHAGRHNIEQNGPALFIQYLVDNFSTDPAELKLYFSPYAISYQITKLHNQTMQEAAMEQFIKSGVLIENIIDPGIDTTIDGNYPSSSMGDKINRFAVAVKRI